MNDAALPALHPRQFERWFSACAASFASAALVIAAVQVAAPITRGWWLVAYLFLVGGVSQLLLGPGLGAIARTAGARTTSPRAALGQLVLWNLGTAIVAVADLATAPAGVVFGSVLLLVALGSFGRSLRDVHATATRPARQWVLVYALLLVFLAGSVLVGTGLARAFPGQ